MDDDQPQQQPDPPPEPPPSPSSVPDDPTQGLGLEFEWKGGPEGGETLDDVLGGPGIERRG